MLTLYYLLSYSIITNYSFTIFLFLFLICSNKYQHKKIKLFKIMNENENKAGEINDQEQDPQIFIKLDDNEVIQFPLSKFNDILNRQITEYLNEANNENIINPKELVNVENWKKNYVEMSYKAKKLDSIVKQLEKDLMKDKFAQPQRFRFFDFGQNVDLSFNQTNG